MAASSSSSSSPFSYAPVAINPRIETDEVLGALPENWQLSQWGKRSLFVDHELKITTWIDPRTYNLRKHDIREVVPGELPYGWEEAFDQVCGVYYIDHVTRANFLEGPWNPEVQEQVLEMRSKLEGDARRLADQLELEYVKRQEVVQVEENLKKLEATRRRIESELMLMRQQAFDEAMGITSSSQGYGNGGGGGGGTEEEMKLREELVEIENALEQEKIEFEYVTEEHEAIQFEIDEFQNRLAELHAVNERLAIENMDLVEQAETTNHNLMEMREMIEAEAHQRRVLEDYIRSLKTEVIGLFDPDQAEHIRGYDELMRDPEHEETAPLPDIGSLDPRMELLALRARLEDEKEEKRRLRELTETLEAERFRIQTDIMTSETPDYSVPEWILDLNVTTNRVKTLKRSLVAAMTDPYPENLDFKSKLNKFASVARESGEAPKTPQQLRKEKSASRGKTKAGKETAFAADVIYGGKNAEEDDDLAKLKRKKTPSKRSSFRQRSSSSRPESRGKRGKERQQQLEEKEDEESKSTALFEKRSIISTSSAAADRYRAPHIAPTNVMYDEPADLMDFLDEELRPDTGYRAKTPSAAYSGRSEVSRFEDGRDDEEEERIQRITQRRLQHRVGAQDAAAMKLYDVEISQLSLALSRRSSSHSLGDTVPIDPLMSSFNGGGTARRSNSRGRSRGRSSSRGSDEDMFLKDGVLMSGMERETRHGDSGVGNDENGENEKDEDGFKYPSHVGFEDEDEEYLGGGGEVSSATMADDAERRERREADKLARQGFFVFDQTLTRPSTSPEAAKQRKKKRVGTALSSKSVVRPPAEGGASGSSEAKNKKKNASTKAAGGNSNVVKALQAKSPLAAALNPSPSKVRAAATTRSSSTGPSTTLKRGGGGGGIVARSNSTGPSMTLKRVATGSFPAVAAATRSSSTGPSKRTSSTTGGPKGGGAKRSVSPGRISTDERGRSLNSTSAVTAANLRKSATTTTTYMPTAASAVRSPFMTISRTESSNAARKSMTGSSKQETATTAAKSSSGSGVSGRTRSATTDSPAALRSTIYGGPLATSPKKRTESQGPPNSSRSQYHHRG